MNWRLMPWCLFLCMSACAEENVSAGSSPADSSASDAFEPQTAVYRCEAPDGEVVIVTRSRPNGTHIFLPPGTGGGHLDCEHDRRASIWEHAKLNGVSFRGVGNEPGWVLEIRTGDRMDLSYDYGQARLSVPIMESRSDADSRLTTLSGASGDRSMLVRLSGDGCSDTMSDETYPTRVHIEFDGRTLSGCGRPLH